MTDPSMRWAIGLMSGTSRDGIDAALLRSDGAGQLEPDLALSEAYDESFRDRLTGVIEGTGSVEETERDLTERHAVLVKRLLEAAGRNASEITVVGFHGHTVLHEPEAGRTCQIGDGELLSSLVGIDVVSDFRSQDMAAGGEGAPFAPLYHAALAQSLDRPLAVLNLGGVGNVTWIGYEVDGAELPEILAFDTGPGNALIDDWVQRRLGQTCDRDGALAAQGSVSQNHLRALLDNPYFDRRPPKSLDRDDFDTSGLSGLSDADGAATLTAFTAATVAGARMHFPQEPRRWLVTGGGRHNPTLMAAIQEAVDAPVDPVESVGWDGDALEAQAFAYLALRSLDGRPLSVPGTTGVREPTCGGVHHRAQRESLATS